MRGVAHLLLVVGASIVAAIDLEDIPYHPASPRVKRQAYPIYTGSDTHITVDSKGISSDSGPWEHWGNQGDCSRTCGGGVQTQTRRCQDTSCRGPTKRYTSCNIDPCDTETDYRDEQCSAHNDSPFEGKYYEWVPFNGGPAESRCSLMCKPKTESWKYKFADKVVDGTKCDTLTNSVCVEGYCLPLGCDKMLGSSLKEDKCLECGGDGSKCKTMEGFFDERELAPGYHTVISLPTGATNIHIQEMRSSEDVLAIRNDTDHYYLNGDYRLSTVSQILAIAGTQFVYEIGATRKESISARGPLTEEIHIAVVHQSKSKDSAIKFEFSIPLLEDIQYVYKPAEWSDCNVTCGKGAHTRRATCFDMQAESFVAEQVCEDHNASLPILSKECMTVDCEATWFTGEWEDCSESCGSDGVQYRVVYCQQVLADGKAVRVDDESCMEDRPEYTQKCNRFSCPEWNSGPWSACSKKCGPQGMQYRAITCRSEKEGEEGKLLAENACDAEDKPEANRECNLGPCTGMRFETTDWEICSKCNDTTETRTVKCIDEQDNQYPKEKCISKKEPSIPIDERSCATPVPCVYAWHTSEWSKCSTTCGHGHQERRVFCAIEEENEIKIMDETHCDPSAKPEKRQECTNEETCTGTWYMTKWGECSEPCGGGRQNRTVVCLNYDKKPKDDLCDEAIMPVILQGCNEDPCPLCEETQFGCCPDNATAAKGPFNTGCSNCTYTDFGCCADNVTAAQGHNRHGCPGIDDIEGSGEEDSECEEGQTAVVNEAGDVECLANEDVWRKKVLETLERDFDEELEALNGTQHCFNTTYGCCPDWYSTAEGPRNFGCPDIILGDCVNTTYGCCEDDITLARGLRKQGCGEADCAASLYGCCRDRQTIAFGPFWKGCDDRQVSCETSEFGCCPDGDTPAKGKDNIGCDSECKITKFGCCPNGKDTATGLYNEGCGCAYSKHGCCPDGIASAHGPQFYGCPQSCTQSQYGCCPDGRTEARGPRNEGCPCHFTVFGCCPDGTTAADGPHYQGCDDCRKWIHGCCPDWRTKAAGPNQEGCPTTPAPEYMRGGTVSPQKILACELPEDQGEMVRYELKYSFNVLTGECKAFWYGGRGGNENRFNSEEECRTVCVEPPGNGICYLPKVEGDTNCSNYEVSYHYDAHERECKAFYYTGCGGNGNRFRSWEDCNQRCQGLVLEDGDARQQQQQQPHEQQEPQQHQEQQPEVETTPYVEQQYNSYEVVTQPPQAYQPTRHDDVCPLNPDSGPCKDFTEKFHYNARSGNCEKFLYGGCGGNVNNFENLEACWNRCGYLSQQQQQQQQQPTTNYEYQYQQYPMRSSAIKTRDVCELPMASGNCDGEFNSFFYDVALGACMPFRYTGCGGNGNRFDIITDCQTTCERDTNKNIISQLGAGSPEVTQSSADGDDHLPLACSLDKDNGPCDGYESKWFYDKHTGVCRRFYYGGCGGNDNRYNSQEQCQASCSDRADPCRLPKVAGPCLAKIERWYFDQDQQACLSFTFKGCLGNSNNFESESECMEACPQASAEVDHGDDLAAEHVEEPEEHISHKKNMDSDPDVMFTHSPHDNKCNASPEHGPCKASIPAFYFDSNSNTCKQFDYGGCGGNENRFVSMEDCMSECKFEKLQHMRMRDEPVRVQAAVQSVVLDLHMLNEYASELPELCSWQAERGSCYGEHLRWFYDSEKAQCESFSWSGCDGNANRFESLESCERACGTYRLQDVCTMHADAGDCDRTVNKWYFDHAAQQCSVLLYTGCGGNGNRFSSKEECAHLCLHTQDHHHHRHHRVNNETLVHYHQADHDACSQPRDSGPCADSLTQWYYDTGLGDCLPFTYGGCRGNANRYHSKESCQAHCSRRAMLARLEMPTDERIDRCQQTFDAGPCTDSTTRYYYDAQSSICKSFVYGGCGGNSNNFLSLFDCEQECDGIVAKAFDENHPMPTVDIYPQRHNSRYTTGEYIRLNCTVRSAAVADRQVVWFKNEHQLEDENDIEVDGAALHINSARSEQSGKYSCAYGLEGLVSDDVDIHISKSAHPTTTGKPKEPVKHKSDKQLECRDSSGTANCDLIVKTGLCSHVRYGVHCCHSCAQHHENKRLK